MTPIDVLKLAEEAESHPPLSQLTDKPLKTHPVSITGLKGNPPQQIPAHVRHDRYGL